MISTVLQSTSPWAFSGLHSVSNPVQSATKFFQMDNHLRLGIPGSTRVPTLDMPL